MPPTPSDKRHVLKLKKGRITKGKENMKGEHFMKLKPLHSLMRSQKEARNVLEQTTQWHILSPNLTAIPQIVINIPPIIIKISKKI